MARRYSLVAGRRTNIGITHEGGDSWLPLVQGIMVGQGYGRAGFGILNLGGWV